MNFTSTEIILFIGFASMAGHCFFLQKKSSSLKEFNLVILESNRNLFSMFCSNHSTATRILDLYNKSIEDLGKSRLEYQQLLIQHQELKDQFTKEV